MKNFNKGCYELLKRIPKGKVTTYKEIAHALNTLAYRAVGQAMKRNTNPDKIPCYKVIKSNGEIGGYCGSADKIGEKIKKLRADGIIVKDGRIDLDKYLYRF